MNENLNLVEILKDCPKGTKLYSPVTGEVNFVKIINTGGKYHIKVEIEDDGFFSFFFTSQGKLYNISQGECVLFPSKEQRDWSKFKPKQPKFDPKTLQPFDKVLVRDSEAGEWACGIFSHISCVKQYHFRIINSYYKYCISYNDETKHLVGTTEEAPEFYRYWED